MATFIDLLKQAIGSTGNLNTATDGLWYDLFKRPFNGTTTTITGGTTADNGVVKFIEDNRTAMESIKTSLYGTDPNNPDIGTVYEDINTKYNDLVLKYTDFSTNYDAYYSDFVTKYTDFTNPTTGKYEDFVAKYTVLIPHLDESTTTPGSVVAVNRDLQGQNIDGTDKTGIAAGQSYISVVASNLLNGANSQVAVVANDLLDTASRIIGVYDNLTPINTLYTNITDINTNATNISSINTNATNILNINIVSTNITDVSTVSQNINSVKRYSDTYLPPSATAYLTRLDGSALQTGDLYYDTTLNIVRVYDANLAQWNSMYNSDVYMKSETDTIVNDAFTTADANALAYAIALG